jgi:hypothetical protein
MFTIWGRTWNRIGCYFQSSTWVLKTSDSFRDRSGPVSNVMEIKVFLATLSSWLFNWIGLVSELMILGVACLFCQEPPSRLAGSLQEVLVSVAGTREKKLRVSISFCRVSINNLRSKLYSSVLYYTRISRHDWANSKPSSGVVAYRILKLSNHKNSNGSVESALIFFCNCCSQWS